MDSKYIVSRLGHLTSSLHCIVSTLKSAIYILQHSYNSCSLLEMVSHHFYQNCGFLRFRYRPNWESDLFVTSKRDEWVGEWGVWNGSFNSERKIKTSVTELLEGHTHENSSKRVKEYCPSHNLGGGGLSTKFYPGTCRWMGLKISLLV